MSARYEAKVTYTNDRSNQILMFGMATISDEAKACMPCPDTVNSVVHQPLTGLKTHNFSSVFILLAYILLQGKTQTSYEVFCVIEECGCDPRTVNHWLRETCWAGSLGCFWWGSTSPVLLLSPDSIYLSITLSLRSYNTCMKNGHWHQVVLWTSRCTRILPTSQSSGRDGTSSIHHRHGVNSILELLI